MVHSPPMGGCSLHRCVLLMLVALSACNAYAAANVIAIPEKAAAPVSKEVRAENRLPITISGATPPHDLAALPTLQNKENVVGSNWGDRIQMGLLNILRLATIDLPTRQESAEETFEPTAELNQNVTVMISGGFKAALKKLSPKFEAKRGYNVVLVPGPSMGDSSEAIPNRLARGEKADAVIMVGSALENVRNWTQSGSRTELADSSIGMVVKEGDPSPDITTVDALRKTLLEAKSIAYSDSASGTYIRSKMFKKLDIEDQVKDKAYMIVSTPVASEVAKGKYALGFQQVSELLPIAGVTLVGEIPDEVQLITRYAGAVIANAENQKGGRALLDYLSSAEAQEIIHETGLRSVSSGNGCKSSQTLNALLIVLALLTILQ